MRGYAQKPVAVAEVVVGEAALFGAEEKRDVARAQAAPDQARGTFGAANRLMEMARADRGGANDESAIGDGFGNGFELLGARENGRSADSGAGLPKRGSVGLHNAKVAKAEIAHRARGGADVEGVARLDEDDAQVVGFSGAEQAPILKHARFLCEDQHEKPISRSLRSARDDDPSRIVT